MNLLISNSARSAHCKYTRPANFFFVLLNVRLCVSRKTISRFCAFVIYPHSPYIPLAASLIRLLLQFFDSPTLQFFLSALLDCRGHTLRSVNEVTQPLDHSAEFNRTVWLEQFELCLCELRYLCAHWKTTTSCPEEA